MEGMTHIHGGRFLMGSDDFYFEEGPQREAQVSDFLIDTYPVTNRRFLAFIRDTGYVTVAERPVDLAVYPGMDRRQGRPGSAVFIPPSCPVDLGEPGAWWHWIEGADWRHPRGPDSTIEAIMDHPVVQVAYEDAAAYAHWAGKALPSEIEWEFAARGGLDGCPYAWGNELTPGGRIMANYWQGEFPWHNLAPPEHAYTTPVGSFPANGHTLYDMIGNVWEWTRDWFSTDTAEARHTCCAPPRARSARREESMDGGPCPRKVLKGGSHLCAANYCRRYRPAARHAQPMDSPTSHIGFRCVARA